MITSCRSLIVIILTVPCSSDRVPAEGEPHQHQAAHQGPGGQGEHSQKSVENSAANRLIGEVVQSRKRPLQRPSPGRNCLLLLSYLRINLEKALVGIFFMIVQLQTSQRFVCSSITDPCVTTKVASSSAVS